MTTSRRSSAEGLRATSPVTSRLHMRVIVDTCTSRRSASALTVCGPCNDTTTRVRSWGSVDFVAHRCQRAHGDPDERSARGDRVDDRIGGLACNFAHNTSTSRSLSVDPHGSRLRISPETVQGEGPALSSVLPALVRDDARGEECAPEEGTVSSFDVVVVGGGIVGTAAAFELGRAGARTCSSTAPTPDAPPTRAPASSRPRPRSATTRGGSISCAPRAGTTTSSCPARRRQRLVALRHPAARGA